MFETSSFLISRILGISSSVFVSGFAFSASYLGIPALALAPIPLRLQQWQVIYDLGKLVAPTVSFTSSLIWGYTAWTARAGEEWKFYAVAGLATFAFLPWTAVVMLPVNNELMKRAKLGKEDAGDVKDGKLVRESEVLLARWDWMNYVRALLPMVGAWVGLYAALR
jgi:hypothetical protein